MYPNARLTEEGLTLGDNHIPAAWVMGAPALKAEHGYYNRITLTVFVEQIIIDSGVHFEVDA